ncbi:glycerol-3-phosphate dehydrogenase [Mycena sp. CBHHK59/15]|nr:glycerol-3-phosphate dehydrogenase [Mycena sp. CBHHK59/15]
MLTRVQKIRSRSPLAPRNFRIPNHVSLYHHPFKFTMPTSKPQPQEHSKVLVLGAGNFGSCLAEHLGDSDHQVFLWSREVEVVKHFNLHHKNLKYLPEHNFSRTFLLENLTILKRSLHDKTKLPLLIFVNKGIEIGTDALTLEIIADTCGSDVARAATFIVSARSGSHHIPYCLTHFFLVRPSFAKEIVRRQPTSVSVASFTEAEANKTSDLFHQPHFRCYTGSDPIGIELSGALKNVYAIAAGMSDGLGYENNTRAMIITRGLAEMTCIGTAYGASPLTFLGWLDSLSSRNYTVGFRLGQGESLKTIIDTLGSVAEGVSTAKGVKTIIDKLGVKAPIAERVYEVLYQDKETKTAVRELMDLPASRELELPPTIGGQRDN